jgi:hypothetical protein
VREVLVAIRALLIEIRFAHPRELLRPRGKAGRDGLVQPAQRWTAVAPGGLTRWRRARRQVRVQVLLDHVMAELVEADHIDEPAHLILQPELARRLRQHAAVGLGGQHGHGQRAGDVAVEVRVREAVRHGGLRRPQRSGAGYLERHPVRLVQHGEGDIEVLAESVLVECDGTFVHPLQPAGTLLVAGRVEDSDGTGEGVELHVAQDRHRIAILLRGPRRYRHSEQRDQRAAPDEKHGALHMVTSR